MARPAALARPRRGTSCRAPLRHTGATHAIDARINDDVRGGTLLEIAGQVAPEPARHALRTLVSDVRNLHRPLRPDEIEKVKRRHQRSFINGLANDIALGSATLAQLRRGRSPSALERWPHELAAFLSSVAGRSLPSGFRSPSRRSRSPARRCRWYAGSAFGRTFGIWHWTDLLQGDEKAL
jgi:hypothetical protein